MFDVDYLERVEAELNGLDEKRADKAAEQERVEAFWADSACRNLECRREENRALWIEFHSRLAASHARISADHEARVEALSGEGAA